MSLLLIDLGMDEKKALRIALLDSNVRPHGAAARKADNIGRFKVSCEYVSQLKPKRPE